MRFFGLFSKSRIEILVLKRQNVENNSTKQAQKTVGLILFKKLRYLSSKVVILAKWTLWHHILSFLHDLWPLYLYECSIMMNPNRPHGYLMITRHYTINRAFNSVKMTNSGLNGRYSYIIIGEKRLYRGIWGHSATHGGRWQHFQFLKYIFHIFFT